uniref:DUF1725 domain-containing protein n=1 Tax=Capra hircus TaxID=9925 RepID=A0A8C2SG21_CAPHI
MTQQSHHWVPYPENTTILKDACTPVFIAAPFTIARTWKQPRCPLTDEWIKKMWYTYTMDYYSAIKRDEFESPVVRWMNLEPVIQSQVSQRKTNIMYIPYIWNPEKCYLCMYLQGMETQM